MCGTRVAIVPMPLLCLDPSLGCTAKSAGRAQKHTLFEVPSQRALGHWSFLGRMLVFLTGLSPVPSCNSRYTSPLRSYTNLPVGIAARSSSLCSSGKPRRHDVYNRCPAEHASAGPSG